MMDHKLHLHLKLCLVRSYGDRHSKQIPKVNKHTEPVLRIGSSCHEAIELHKSKLVQEMKNFKLLKATASKE